MMPLARYLGLGILALALSTQAAGGGPAGAGGSTGALLQIFSIGDKRIPSVSSAPSPRLAGGVGFLDNEEPKSGAGHWARAILGWLAWILFFRISILFVRWYRRSRADETVLKRRR